MGRNVFAYALGHGLAGGLDAYGDGLQREQQFEQQRRLQQERFDEQERMLQMRGGMGGAGGSSSARAPAIPPMTPESAVAGANTMNAVTDQELIDGGFVPPNANRALPSGYTQSPVMDPRDAATRVTYGPDSQPLSEAPKMVLDRSDPVVMDGIARLKNYRERLYHGAASDDVAKAQATQEDTIRSGKVEKEMGPAAAQLVSKGKGPYDINRTGSGNILTGESKLNPLGQAEAGEAKKKGDAAVIKAEREPEDPTAEARRQEAEKRRQQAAIIAEEKAARAALKAHQDSSKGKSDADRKEWVATESALKQRVKVAQEKLAAPAPAGGAQLRTKSGLSVTVS